MTNRFVKTMWKAAAFATAFLVLSGCASTTQISGSSPSSGGSIVGRWSLDTITLKNAHAITAPASANAWIEFDRSGAASGFDSVNRWQSTYMLNGNQIRLSKSAIGGVGTGPGASPWRKAATQATAMLLNASATTVTVNATHMTLDGPTYEISATRIG